MFAEERPEVFHSLRENRLQINSHGERFSPDLRELSLDLDHVCQIILQCDEVNNAWVLASHGKCVRFTVLFDASGGNGVIPDVWPQANFSPVGYAGGLSPENIMQHLGDISLASNYHNFWIDAESSLRVAHDRVFSLPRVAMFLQTVRPYIEEN